ncbi:MAG: hypothetical protein H0U88_01295 [Chthoniobacterales bacterium]|nr:hypothetical protein [Chthoniobacterales bacterium]
MGDSALDRGNDIIPLGAGFVVRKASTVLGESTFWTNIFPVQALGAVSRKVHGVGGPTFDVNLPLAGKAGVECRNGPITKLSLPSLLL